MAVDFEETAFLAGTTLGVLDAAVLALLLGVAGEVFLFTAFLAGAGFLATGFLAAGLDALVFFGVGMVQPSVMKRIGWRHQQSHALENKRRPIKDKTGTEGQAVRANIWIAALAVGWPG